MKNILTKLNIIQTKLSVPKNQRNNFGNYNYRSSEDILEGVKPLLDETKTIINVSDEIEMFDNRFYVKATATIYDIETGESISAVGYAREEESKKGMDASQLTGATSSYARKYALNGLLAIDDNKDSDSTNKHGQEEKKQDKKEENNEFISQPQQKRLFAIAKSNAELVKGVIKNYGHESTSTITKQEYKGICDDIEHLMVIG
jgi:hypothetical protein